MCHCQTETEKVFTRCDIVPRNAEKRNGGGINRFFVVSL